MFKEPTLFREVFGNENTKTLLKRTLRNDGASNFFLLTGPKGHGKSTLSDVSAMYTLCENPTELHEPCQECEHCRSFINGVPKDLVKVNVGEHSSLTFINDFRSTIEDAMSEKLVIQLEELQEMDQKTQGAMLEVLDKLTKKESQVIVIATSYKPYNVTKAIRDRAFVLQVGLTSYELKVFVEAVGDGQFSKKTINYLLQKKLSPREYKIIMQNHMASSLTNLHDMRLYFRDAEDSDVFNFLSAFISPYVQFHEVMHNYTDDELRQLVKDSLFSLTRVSMSHIYDAGNKSAGDYEPTIKQLFINYSSEDMYRLIYYLNSLLTQEDLVNEVYAAKYLYERSKKDMNHCTLLTEQNRQLYAVIENIEKQIKADPKAEVMKSEHYNKIMTHRQFASFGSKSFKLPGGDSNVTT